MMPKMAGSVPPHRKPMTIRMIALVWSELRSGRGPAGWEVIAVVSWWCGGWWSVGQGAPVGITFEGLRPREHHDALDQAPDAADAAGADRDDDLDDADGGVAHQEAVHPVAAEEDAQQPHHETALRLPLRRLPGSGLPIGVRRRRARPRGRGPARLPVGIRGRA